MLRSSSLLLESFLRAYHVPLGVSIPLILAFQNHQPVNQSTNDPPEYFTHPLLQTAMIFLGEIACILVIQLASKAPSLLDRSMLQVVAPQQPQQHEQLQQQQQQGYGDHPDWTAAATHTSKWSLFWFIVPSACDLIATTVCSYAYARKQDAPNTTLTHYFFFVNSS